MDKTEICNAALAHIGQWRIADYDEAVPIAQACRNSWDSCRRSSLRSFHWNFALWRAPLSEDATEPQHGYDHAFVLPSDYILALQVNGISAGTQAAPFSIEGGRVLTDDTTVNLWYVRDVEEVSRWDDSFREYFGYRLAAAVAPSITASNSISESLEGRAMAMLNLAKGHDSVESRPHVVRGPYYSGYAAARGGYVEGTA